ncbi:hypothetical protein JW992_02785, partial [candidate division KSB1 bacterium]|nr:hypothetical protein [candidate division KSB1 bacterium]
NGAPSAPNPLPFYIAIGVAVLAIAFIVFREVIFRSRIETNTLRIRELERLAAGENEEKNRLAGENRQLVAQAADVRAKHQLVQDQLARVQEKVVRFESEREEQTREYSRMIRDLENSRRALQDEQARVRKQEEERREQEERERDRMWAVHEQETLAAMRQVCQKPNLGFVFYEANNLPESFDASLKPDFLVEFLESYIIFDAKISKSANLATYIKTQVKSSALKYKTSACSESIYKTAFFVVPTAELKNLKETSFFELGYRFLVISIEAFEPILSAFRRVADYDLVDRFNPQERENIVDLIALLSQHIRHQNAANVLNTLMGVKALQECGILPENMARAVEERLKTMRLPAFKPSDLKRLVASPEEQIREIIRLVRPAQAPVSDSDLEKFNTTPG